MQRRGGFAGLLVIVLDVLQVSTPVRDGFLLQLGRCLALERGAVAFGELPDAGLDAPALDAPCLHGAVERAGFLCPPDARVLPAYTPAPDFPPASTQWRDVAQIHGRQGALDVRDGVRREFGSAAALGSAYYRLRAYSRLTVPVA